MRGFVIGADAQYGIALLFQYLFIVTKVASLGRASGGVVFWIKIQDHLFTFVIAEAYLFTVLIFRGKVGSFVARF
jgi:hypothetical protein